MTVPAGWEGIVDPGETILWQGRPDRRFIWADLLSSRALIGLFLAGFALYWVNQSGGLGAHAPDFIRVAFPAVGAILALVGLNITFSPPIRDMLTRGSTFYTLTDRAAYIATARGGRRNLDRHLLSRDMTLSLQPGNPGGVVFAVNILRSADMIQEGGGTMRGYQSRVAVGFRRIAEAEAVFALLRSAIAALPPRT